MFLTSDRVSLYLDYIKSSKEKDEWTLRQEYESRDNKDLFAFNFGIILGTIEKERLRALRELYSIENGGGGEYHPRYAIEAEVLNQLYGYKYRSISIYRPISARAMDFVADLPKNVREFVIDALIDESDEGFADEVKRRGKRLVYPEGKLHIPLLEYVAQHYGSTGDASKAFCWEKTSARRKKYIFEIAVMLSSDNFLFMQRRQSMVCAKSVTKVIDELISEVAWSLEQYTSPAFAHIIKAMKIGGSPWKGASIEFLEICAREANFRKMKLEDIRDILDFMEIEEGKLY